MIPGRNDIIYEDVVTVGERGVLVSAFDYRNFDYLVKPDGTRVIDIFYLLPKSYTARFMYDDNILWLPKQQQIFLIDLDRIDKYKYENDVLIRKVIVGGDSVLFNGVFFEETGERHRKLLKHQPESQVPKINHSLNDITFNWSSNNFMSDDSTVYSFMIEGFDKEWSKWEHVNYKDYTNLQHGKYKFKIKAKGLTRIESDITVYEFEIAKAWYQTVFAMIIYAILIIVIVVGIIKVYTRRLINENVRLEGIVADRTKEVVRQKEELEASIHYASRIQRAILPSEKILADKVEEYFILFRPRDIVSGDFYWISQKGSRLYIVAADCTGHGVPGAFMSILGISFLDEIVNKADNTDTDKILNLLRKHVTDSLKQMEEGIEETKDGMDIGILVINYEANEIEYSGAYNPCWLVRELTEGEKISYLNNKLKLSRTALTNGKYLLETIEADRMPIGISSRMNQSFRMHTQKLEKGVSYYLLSDGYSDQFGGENGRKFLKKNLKKLILDVQGMPMKKQKALLEKNLEDWMGDNDQVDDILVMGIRVI
jgi:serine phosphatase RsbU (regulator of sigma subunit)